MTRRNIIIYQPAIKNAYDEKQLIKKKITDAIINKKFIILYQLKVNYCTKKVTGIEALLRLRKNDSDFFNTEMVIEVAKEYNLMGYIDRFLIKKVMEDYSRIVKVYPEVSISINLTVKEMEQNYHIGLLSKYAEKYKFPLYKLYIELTQEEIIKLKLIEDVLLSFRKLKIKLSMDDFGSKYNSFYRLTKIKYDEIKIDKSITDQYDKFTGILNCLSTAFINAGYEVVIEGVENAYQLRGLPCSEKLSIQGYIYSRPTNLKKLEEEKFKYI